jgi:type IV secretion system protein VirB9
MNGTKRPLSGALLLSLLLGVSLYSQTTASSDTNPITPTTPPKPVTPAVGSKAKPGVKHVPEKAPIAPPALSSSGKAAVTLSDKWKDGTLHGESPVSIDAVGRVRFPFGDSLPTVVCAPKGVCAIELEAGEALRGDPHLGDRVRWHLELEYFGDATDGTQTAVLIAKPDFGSLDTDLIVTTNRRAYYIRLVSDEQKYMPQVSFVYPADEQRKIREMRDQHAITPAAPLSLASLMMPAGPTPEDKVNQTRNAIASMEFDFTIKSDKQAERDCLRPRSVYEDKKAGSTVIQMESCVNVRNLPIVLVKEGSNYVKPNYRYTDGSFIVDQLIDSAVLRVGGKHGDIKREVHIDRTKEVARVR